MFEPFEMQASVDKKVWQAKGCGGGGAQEYLAGGFRKREGKHVGNVVFALCLECYLAHFCGREKSYRKLIALAEGGVFK
jgi:hypothetical protein